MMRRNSARLMFILAMVFAALGCERAAAPPATVPPIASPTAVPRPSATPVPAPTPTAVEMVQVTVLFPKVTQNEVGFVPVQRTVPRSPSPAVGAINELLKGPTAEERSQGLVGPIPEGTKLKSLQVREGVAYVDFDATMEHQMGGSLRVMSIRQMIIRTLKQFPEIKEVVISVEGRTEDILQP